MTGGGESSWAASPMDSPAFSHPLSVPRGGSPIEHLSQDLARRLAEVDAEAKSAELARKLASVQSEARLVCAISAPLLSRASPFPRFPLLLE